MVLGAEPRAQQTGNGNGSSAGNGSDQSFEAMLDGYIYKEPERGDILQGIILEKRHDEIILDVGLKRDAVVTRKDITRLPEDVLNGLAEGQEVDTFVLQPYNEDGDLVVSINKALELEDWRRAQQMMEEDATTEAAVIDANKGGMLVRFGRLTGFVPNSHIESVPPATNQGRLREIKYDLIGRKLQLKVIQVETKRNRLILSERAARRAARSERLDELSVGQVLTGKVVNLTDFGAFVDIGGVDGMIHISNIDHRHVNHPSDVLTVGDEVDVRIDSIDRERERIALNRKAVLPDPWQTFTDNYNSGDLMEGIVTNVVDFGVFVAAPGGAQGLVHTSRMSSLGASTPRDMFREGDPVLVRIVGIDSDRGHIELSIDDVSLDEQQEWLHRRREEARINQEGSSFPDDEDVPSATKDKDINTDENEDGNEDGNEDINTDEAETEAGAAEAETEAEA
jgi:small subunit ribosomal protein S1